MIVPMTSHPTAMTNRRHVVSDAGVAALAGRSLPFRAVSIIRIIQGR
jgi:acyl-CoA hydrolase